ncbi:MAG: hypothetical protein WD116_04895 [Chloroflexota bacterium]
MTERATAFPTIRLARGRARLVGGPAAFLLAAAGALVGGVLVAGPARIALLGLGGLAVLVALYLFALVASYRLQIEPGGLLLRWFGGQRRYRLVRGPVTRVAVRGPSAAALHPRFGALGWAVGPAVLRHEEPIELIRLATGVPLILVPTDRGRLAIAPEVEGDLLAALSTAVRLQERIDEVAMRRAAPPAQPAQVAPPPPPRILTGIERTLLEQRLAAERAASQAADDPGAPAIAAAAMPDAMPDAMPQAQAPAAPALVVAAAARPARRRERARWERPTWLAIPGPASVVAALPIAAPLIGAAIAWVAVVATGRPVLPIPEARLLLVALILVGPLGAAGALIARAWYPRLGGLVAATSLAGLAMLTRTLLS